MVYEVSFTLLYVLAKMNEDDMELHPMVEKMYALGCKSKRKISLTLRVFFDLCEVKGMWDTQCIYNSKLDLIYITGKWGKKDSTEIVVPMSASSSVSPCSLIELQSELIPEGERKIITIAFVVGDSSICYYQAESGLHPPDSPETVRKRRNQEERRQCRAVEMIHKARDMLSNVLESESVDETTASDPKG
ncbi:uncharacterized protein LOC124161040 [Ischnura elegans]|uniref:uncharacterized protein LOC124161040 n=1 Tax=Ischnura elegans TaxID=197161 RepID=UPI001ED86F03|nr:uncharacterized protein LOC124161040 [Ischnura elegans]XP_046393144.1 uncharacterized protein LOC124161040 [Ischnura elegans]XP_046393145.1 uncharacterized protein LOC124161040 [Ischnura elegans]